MSRRLAGALAFLLTALLLSWRVSRAAFWIDESASVAATRRSWPGLIHLVHGPEAPLVPFYLVLKPLAALGDAAGLPLEAAYRWPSVAAVALAAGFLVSWITARAGTALGLATLAVLLLTAGVSRYGQEARPYAGTALFAVLATIAWYRLREARSRRPRSIFFVLYALAVAALASLHLLAATLVIAHLVAAALLGGSGRRSLRDVLLTAGSALLGAVVSAPFTVIGALNAKGPMTATPTTAQRLGETFVQLFTWYDAFWHIGWLIVLAAVGAFGLALSRYRAITVVALCWAIVPLLVLVPAMYARPTLLRLRYLVFVIPGWALLGGLGIVVLGTLVQRGLARVSSPRPGVSVPGVAGVAVGVAVVVAVGFSQWPSLTRLREPDGHGEDVRPAVAFIDARPKLPVMISGRAAGSVMAAYRPGIGSRLLGSRLQYTGLTIWPDLFSVAERRVELKDHDEVLVLVRNSLNDVCRRQPAEAADAFVQRCMPRPLRARGYHVVSAEGAGSGYAAGLVKR